MALWANSVACDNFKEAVEERLDGALRGLLRCNSTQHEEFKQKYKAYKDVLGFIEEARNME